MSESKGMLVVRCLRSSRKYIVMSLNPEFPHLSPNDGEMTEPELKTCLAEKYGRSSSEIESLINEANAIPEFGPSD